MKQINYFFLDILEFKKSIPKKSWLIDCIEKENRIALKIDFMFCSDIYLQQLNKKILNHNTLTDVITLDYSFKKYLLGDVFISIDRVKENANKYKTSFKKELSRVMIHGILHLIGYNDKSANEKEIMRKMENKYLQEKNF